MDVQSLARKVELNFTLDRLLNHPLHDDVSKACPFWDRH